jgi:hypothetical protein
VRLLLRIGSLAHAVFCALLLLDVEGDGWRIFEGALLAFATLAWVLEAVVSLAARRSRTSSRE